MSESETTEERIAAAAALRRLGHALVGHDVDDRVLLEISEKADEFLSAVEKGPSRSRPIEDLKRRMFERIPAESEVIDHYAECVVSGTANPMGLGIQVSREGNSAVSRVTLGPAYEGAPGRAHGGIISAVFDEVMSYVLSIIQTPAFTGRLTVSYRAPAPLNRPLEFTARLSDRDGRKIFITAEAIDGETLIAKGEGLFIAIPPERLGLGIPGDTLT